MLFRLLAVLFAAAAIAGCTTAAPGPQSANIAQSPALGLSQPSTQTEAVGPIHIVAVGASNTAGWGVGKRNAFPTRLEALLRAQGIEAYVRNAGVVASTTSGMLRRIDSAVPAGTDLVILQPGGNDLRFFGTIERRQANIAAIERRLRERGIKLIVYDPVFPPEYFTWDGIHFTRAAHAEIAAQLVPMVSAALAIRTPPSETARL